MQYLHNKTILGYKSLSPSLSLSLYSLLFLFGLSPVSLAIPINYNCHSLCANILCLSEQFWD